MTSAGKQIRLDKAPNGFLIRPRSLVQSDGRTTRARRRTILWWSTALLRRTAASSAEMCS